MLAEKPIHTYSWRSEVAIDVALDDFDEEMYSYADEYGVTYFSTAITETGWMVLLEKEPPKPQSQ